MYRRMLLTFVLFVVTASGLFAAENQPAEQIISSALWRIDHNFRSTLRIGNSSPTTITVYPALFMQDGFRYALAPVTLAPSVITTISINDALANASQDAASHFSQYGSVAVKFTAETSRRVSASVQILDPVSSLAFVSQCGARGSQNSSSQLLEGLWWKHDDGVGGFVALTNTTANSLAATYQLVTQSGARLDIRSLSIASHSTVMLDLNTLIAQLPSSEASTGGLRIGFQGHPGDLILLGGLENPSEGYSATMPFVSAFQDGRNGKTQSRTYASVGLMTGMPMSMMGFPAGTKFQIYSVLRNTTEHPLQVTTAFNYMGSQGPVSIPVSVEELPPFHSRQVNVQRLIKQAKLSDFNGMLNLSLSFEGKIGDLLAATGSVDETGNYVFEVQPQGVGQSLAKQVSYWSTANGYDTMIGLLNSNDTPQDITVTFRTSGSNTPYTLPVHLDGHASTNLDMAELIALHQPDSEGNFIEGSAPEGTAVFENSKDALTAINLIVSVGVFNVKAATCTSVCVNCIGFTTVWIKQNPATLILTAQPAGTTHLLLLGNLFNPGRNQNTTVTVDPGFTTWASSDSTIMAVDNSGTSTAGTATAVGLGSVTISADATLTPEGGASSNCDLLCPDDVIFPASPVSGQVNHAVPINYRQNGPAVDAGGGVLHFSYAWDSSSGDVVDLTNCTIREYVHYQSPNDPFLWPTPPYQQGASAPNPSTPGGSGAGINLSGTAPDDQLHPPFQGPYSPNTNTVNSTQYFQYSCPGTNGGQFVDLMGPIAITRTVSFDGVSTWTYTVTKSGASASTILP